MLDVVVRAPAGVEAGTDVPGTVRFRLGGSAANTARAFAGLGGAAAFVGTRGQDELGRRLVTALRASGVTVHVVARRGITPRLAAIVEESGQRSFVTDRSVADDLPAAAIKTAWFRRADILHLPAYSLLGRPIDAASLFAARAMSQRGALVSVDLASRRPLLDAGRATVRKLLNEVAPDVLFANADEAAAVVGPRRDAPLLELAPVVVIKEGAAGCRVLWRGDSQGDVLEIDVATRSIVATDTTGAGDAFDAGFLHALVAGGYTHDGKRPTAVLRRAALAGHRSAARLLTSPRPELVL